MFAQAEPRYRAPSRNQVSETLIPALFQEVLDEVKSALLDAPYVALTSDGWTSRVTQHYLTITCHYVEDWELRSKVYVTFQLHFINAKPAVYSKFEFSH